MEENIRKLIERYKNKIKWLEERKNNENQQFYEGIQDGLETAIYDLCNILDGIDM